MIRPGEFAKANGSRLQSDMHPGDPLLWPLLERWDAATFSGRITQGIRAVTIPVDDMNSVAGLIHPGDLIDLYFTAKPPELPGGAKAMGGEQTFLLLQAMKVMATGQSVKTEKTVSSKQGGEMGGYGSITLSVTPDQAQRIMVAQKAGAFRIALRNPNDDAQINSRSMDTGTLFGDNPTVQHTGSLAEIIVGGRGISRSWQAVSSSTNSAERVAPQSAPTATSSVPADR
jgi:pilus assembly protein CpaB